MLKEVIEEFEDIVEFHVQGESDAESYFKDELELTHVPAGVVEFYKEYDGARLSISDVFSLEEIKEELEDFDIFLNAMGINPETSKYVPIANDGMGGYYAFLSNSEEETIYYLDHEFPDDINTYDSFEDFLRDICEMDADM